MRSEEAQEHFLYTSLNETAIPEGRYPLVMTKSMRFKKWLPLLLGVPGFSGVRIHAGNTAKDTQGCILVGENKKVGMVVNSRIWLQRLIVKFIHARDKDEAVYIQHPKIHAGQIVSGEWFVDSKEKMRGILEHFPHAMAVIVTPARFRVFFFEGNSGGQRGT